MLNDTDYSALQSGMNSLNTSLNAAGTSISTAELNRVNRDFYEEQWQIQRENDWRKMLAQMDYNTQERAEVQKWQEGMWNLQFNAMNEYNTPANQMSRLMAAGINPNSAAGLVSGNQGSASVPSSPAGSSSLGSPSPAGQPQIFNPSDSFTSMMNVGANAEAALAQAQLSRQMAKKTEVETTGLLIDNDYKPFEKQADLDNAYNKILLMTKQGILTDAQATQILEMLEPMKGKTYAEINKLMSDASLASAELGRVQESINLLKEQIESEKHRQKQMDAAAYEAYMSGEAHKSAIEVNGTVMSLNQANEALRDAEAEEQRLKNNWRQHCLSLGYDPDSHHIDRLIDSAGSNIKLMEQYGNQIIDITKQQLNSVGNFFSGAFNSSKSSFNRISKSGSKWSKIWE